MTGHHCRYVPCPAILRAAVVWIWSRSWRACSGLSHSDYSRACQHTVSIRDPGLIADLLEATKADIELHFNTHGTGEITEIKLMNGFGFIEYKDAMDARDVVPGKFPATHPHHNNLHIVIYLMVVLPYT